MGSDTGAKFSHTVYVVLDYEIGATGVYGQTSPVTTGGLELFGVYGQTTPVPTTSIEPFGVYGQTVGVSGILISSLESNINGLGDIIYYGDAGSLDLDGCQILGDISDPVLASGLALASGDQASIAVTDSLSIMASESGSTAVLPSTNIDGVYLYFYNQNGQPFSVSSSLDIVTSLGPSGIVAIDDRGDHLGVIGAGGKWIAIEESGVA